MADDDPKLSLDNPGGDWLARKVKYAEEKGRDEYGAPHLGDVTASFRKVNLPVDLLATLKGLRGEQGNVREQDLAWLKSHMEETGKLPLLDKDDPASEEYVPFITVGYDGVPWVSEGNHRIMAAKALGWKTLPVELRYFDGGERAEGLLFPEKVSSLHKDLEYLSEKTNDPRPTDPSVLEKGLMASDIGSRVAGDIRDLKKPPPGQQLVPKEKPPAKGQMFRGIGSLMRGRISPIVTAAQLFWGEMPESVKDDAGAMVNWLRENKMHELVGLDKPGIEYFKQALTPTAQEPKGIMSLPPMLQSGEFDWDYDSDTLGERIKVRHGTPSPEIEGGRFDIGEFSLKEDPLGQGAAMKGTGLYSAQALDVAGDYFNKEPKGRVLLNNKLLPKSFNIPKITELDKKMALKRGDLGNMRLKRKNMEKFAKDFGVDVEDVNILAGILERLEGEMRFGDTTDTSLDFVLRNAEQLVLENTKKAREARKFVEVHLPDERVYPGRIFSQERSAEVLERRVADNLRLIEVMNKYNLKGTPGALVEFAYHPEDWKNMIDLDMKLSDQPEILEKVLRMPSVKLLMEDNLPGLMHMAAPESIRQLDGADRLSAGFASLGQEWLVTRYLDGQELSMDLLQVIARDTNSERQAKIILAKEFADAGIPGNKYFDQQSRYADPPPDVSEPIGFTLNGDTMHSYLKKVQKRKLGFVPDADLAPSSVPALRATRAFRQHGRDAENIIFHSKGLPEALDFAKSLPGEDDWLNKMQELEPNERPTWNSGVYGDVPPYASDLVISLIEEMIENGVQLDLTYPEPKEDTRTKNAVVWDQKAMDRATTPTVLEGGFPPKSKADGGLVDKPLYEQPRMVG